MRLALLLALAVGLASGCGDDDGNGTDVLALEDVPWLLSVPLDVEDSDRVASTAIFTDGRLSGSAGCNQYGTEYTVDGDKLELGEIARTLKACPPPFGDVETAFLAALEKVVRWRVEASDLQLLDAGGEQLLRFQQASPAGAWIVTGFLRDGAVVTPLDGTELTATFSTDGELTGSAGCNTYQATYTSNFAEIEISPPAVTEKACAEPEGVMEQEASFLQSLPVAERFDIDGRQLTLTRAFDGSTVVELERAP